jgi:hypothetical protein
MVNMSICGWFDCKIRQEGDVVKLILYYYYSTTIFMLVLCLNHGFLTIFHASFVGGLVVK